MRCCSYYHSDHTSGIPDVWLTGWLTSFYARRTRPFRVIGPHGAQDLMSHLEQAYAADIRIRIEDEKLHPKASPSRSRNSTATASYTRQAVRVIAFEVDHGDAIKPAYGYRIEYGGRAAVISGDTRYNENVVKHGAGADLLVHEVAAARPALMGEAYIQRIIAHHDAARSGPRFLAHASEACRLYAPGAARERQGSAAGSAGSDRRDARDL